MLLMASALVATAAPALAQFGLFSDPDHRMLLGLGIIVVTLIITLLLITEFLYAPMKRKIRRRQSYRDGASVAPSSNTFPPSSSPRPDPLLPRYFTHDRK